jgi:hypothetical protein
MFSFACRAKIRRHPLEENSSLADAEFYEISIALDSRSLAVPDARTSDSARSGRIF